MSSDAGRPFSRLLILSRMSGAAALNSRTFDEVKSDEATTIQALVVVVMAAVATGIGLGTRLGGLPVFVVGWSVSWATWVLIVYVLTTVLRPGPPLGSLETAAEPDPLALARAAGFAQSPVIFQVFGVIPGLGVTAYTTIFVVVSIWQVAAVSVGVRQWGNYGSTLRAVLVVAAGFAPSLVLELVLS